MKHSVFLIILPFILINNYVIAQPRNDLHKLVGYALVDYTNNINQRYAQYVANPAYCSNTHAIRFSFDPVNNIYDVYVQRFFQKSEIDTLNYDLIYFNGHFFYLINEKVNNHTFIDDSYFVDQGLKATINSVIFQEERIAEYGKAIGYIVCIYHYRIDFNALEVELMRIAPADQLNRELWPIKNLNSYYQRAVTDEITFKTSKSDMTGKKEIDRRLKKELKDINVWLEVPMTIY